MPKSRPKTQTPLPATDAPRPPVELAGVGVRLICVVYDALLIIALNAIVGAILVGIATPQVQQDSLQATVLPSSYRQLVLFPAMVLTTWLFYGYFWRRRGQTLGMQTWRLQVIRPDGSLLGWSDAFGRCAAAMILPGCCGLGGYVLFHRDGVFLAGALFGFIANYLWARVGRRGLAWHDLLSGTVVIRLPKESTPKRGLLGWFSRN